jgi:hypothetical protein
VQLRMPKTLEFDVRQDHLVGIMDA